MSENQKFFKKLIFVVYSGKAGDVSSYQSDDGALSSELCRAEERPDEAVDEFVLWVDNRVVVRNLLPLCVFRGGIIKDDLSGQRRKPTGGTKRKNKRHKTDKQTNKKKQQRPLAIGGMNSPTAGASFRRICPASGLSLCRCTT